MITTKNTTKGLLTILTLIAFSSVTFAQNTANANAKASATVLAAITVTQAADLGFGNVTPGNAKSVLPNGSKGAYGVVSGTTTAAQWNVTKGADSEVEVKLTTPKVLAGDGANTLLVSFATDGEDKEYAVISTGAVDATGFVAFNAEGDAPVTASTGTYSAFFKPDAFSVYLGGKVSPSETQAAGTYTADLTLTVTYN